uniref:tubulin-like doman-containing protein n=1 Tax=Runella sp. TaxID=1960881 RepID=UPI0026189E9D
MDNHLIIGLGGTGGKIIRSLRKTIYQEYRNNKPEGVNIGYLYMDTSDEMMDPSDNTWRVLGTSVQLEENSKVFIQPGDLGNILENINNYPNIKDWIGATENWKSYLKSLSGLKIAGGQRRRLGRFILTSNIVEFTKKLILQVNALTDSSGQADVHFHVCCGLGGGTGAGTLIDVLAQIRRLFNTSVVSKFKITLYLFVPEENPKDDRAKPGFYHSNGYAALSELNAYINSVYMPIDISITSATSEPRLKNIKDPVYGAYLFSTINSNGNTVDIDQELPQIAADFLFQKLISIRDIEWKNNVLSKAEDNENFDAKPEKSALSPIEERSVRFLAFGVKRIAIPEEEIREFITYNYASQAALQLRFNNWSDETGFRNESVNQNFGELVADKRTHERWRMTDEHFQLSLPIIDDTVTKRWKKIGDTWRFIIPEYKTISKEKKDTNWLDELKKLCDKQFVEQYRNMGVQKFYEAKIKDRKDLAREIVNKIEKEIFEEWKNGQKSLFDIRRLLEVLIENLEKRLSERDDKLVSNQQNEERSLATIVENEKTWSSVGDWAEIFFKTKTQLLDAQSVAFEELYIYKTQYEGLKFAKTSMSETIEQLYGFKAQINTSNQTIDSALKVFEKNIAERCNDDEAKMKSEESYKQQVVRFYDPAKVRAITKRFVRDRKEQASQTSNVRNALVSRLGDQPNFTVFNERISTSMLISELEKTCDQNAKNAEASLEGKDKLFNIGIVSKLKERYDGNFEELGKYVRNMINYSGYWLTLDKNEINKSGDGTHNAFDPKRTFSVIIPKSDDNREFVEELKNAFRANYGQGITFVESADKKNEIVIISLINGFPLRYMSNLKYLKSKYDDRIAREDS